MYMIYIVCICVYITLVPSCADQPHQKLNFNRVHLELSKVIIENPTAHTNRLLA